MSSTTLFYSIRHTMGRRLWFSALLCVVVFLFMMPIAAAFSLQHATEQWVTTAELPRARAVIAGEINHIFQATNAWTCVPLLLGAFLAGLLFFSYLHSRKRVDLFHSLPLSRPQLFTINYTAGALSVLLPYLINLLLTILVVVCMGLGAALHWPTILLGLGMNILFFLAIYTVVVLAAMMTGQFVIQFMTSLFLLGVVPLALSFSYFLGKIFYPTWYTGLVNWTEVILSTSPLTRWILGISSQDAFFTGRTVLLLAILTLLTGLLALLLYRRRPSEVAAQALAFPILRPIIKYPTMVLSMAGVGLAFYEIGQKSIIWFMIGAVLAGLISGQILEVLYRFDFSAVRSKLLAGLICTVLFCGVCGLGFLDVTGYNTYLPQKEDVAKVEIQLPALNGFTVGNLIVPSASYVHFSTTNSILYPVLDVRYGLTTGDAASLDGQKRTRQDQEILSTIQADPLRQYPITSESGKAAALELARLSIQTLNGNGNQYYVEYTHADGSGELTAYQDLDYGLASTYVLIRYTLQNGRTVTRQYASAPLYLCDIQDQVYALYAEEEYRRSQYTVLNLPAEQLWVQSISAFESYDYTIGYDSYQQDVSPDQEDIAQLVSALRQELPALDGQDLREQVPVGIISIRAYAEAATPEVTDSDRPFIQYSLPLYATMEQSLNALEPFGLAPEDFQPCYEEAVEAVLIQYNTNLRYFCTQGENEAEGVTDPTQPEPESATVEFLLNGQTTLSANEQEIRFTDPEEIRAWIDQTIQDTYMLDTNWQDTDPMRSVKILYQDRYGQTYSQYRSLPHPQ